MNERHDLLDVDFDGSPASDVDDVIYEGLDDPRHRERVPGLVELMSDTSESDRNRYLACVALTTWGESAGYQAVVAAAEAPRETPWYGISIDRMYSVNDTFAQLLTAVDDSDEMAVEKSTVDQRAAALAALVRIADAEYFDGKIGYALKPDDVATLLGEIKEVVTRGVASLADGATYPFDVATQLIDLASAVSQVDDKVAVDLVRSVLSVASHHRALSHAVAVVSWGKGPGSREFGEYLMTIADEEVRNRVKEVLEKRP